MPYWRLSGFYFFYFATVGALVPYWGLYLQSIGFTPLDIGLLMSLLTISRVVAPNIWGWIADRRGHRMAVVRLAGFLAVAAFTGVFFGSGFWWLAAVMLMFSFFWNASLPMLEAETLWLNQKQLTELFGKAKGTISEHIKHVFEDGELTPEATVRLFRTVQPEGGRDVTREVEHYNQDMILALGFRVRSPVGVRFRQWANDKLKEYIVKGFVLDDARLKNPGKGRNQRRRLDRRHVPARRQTEIRAD